MVHCDLTLLCYLEHIKLRQRAIVHRDKAL